MFLTSLTDPSDQIGVIPVSLYEQASGQRASLDLVYNEGSGS